MDKKKTFGLLRSHGSHTVEYSIDAKGRVVKSPVSMRVRVKRDYSSAVRQTIVGRKVIATKGSKLIIRVPATLLEERGGKGDKRIKITCGYTPIDQTSTSVRDMRKTGLKKNRQLKRHSVA